MPTLEEVHLGLGSGECTFDYDPELLEELADFRHLLFYRHGRLLGTTVILSKMPSEEGITVSGYGLGFWLGIDNDGPVIESREYIAGNNRVDNGGFENLDALGFPVNWKTSEGSKWAYYDTDFHSGSRSMRVTANLGKDDTLISSPPREVPVGAAVRVSAWAKRISGSVGRLRLRTVYEGRFDPPDLLEALDFDVDWTNDSETPGDAVSIDSTTLQMGPVTQIQYVANPGFETGDFTDWLGDTAVDSGDGSVHWLVTTEFLVIPGPTVLPHGGSYMAAAHTTSTAATRQRYLGPSTGPGVNPGERYRLRGYAVEGGIDSGEAYLILQCVKGGSGTSEDRPTPALNGKRFADDGSGSPFAYTWKELAVEYDVPDDVTGLLPWLYVGFDPGISGYVLFDDITLTRIKGNTAKYTAPAVTVTPEKSYKLIAGVTGSWPESGPTRNGTLHYAVLLEGTGRTDQIIVSSDLDVSQAATQMVLEHSFTPPSGYDTATVTIVATDLTGGNVLIDKPTLTCEDTSTYIVDKVIGPTGASWTQYTQDSVAPAGTEKIHVELVGEANATGWLVDDVDWHRREDVDTPANILDDLLRDPDTDAYLVNPGTIDNLGFLQYDRTFNNVTNRLAITTVLRGGLLETPCEFRHNPDNTLDAGPADELFAERTEFVFIEPDLLLLDRFEAQQSVEDRLTRVKVIGQALQQKAPLPDAVITGEATTTIPDAYDWNNNPVSRTRIVEDSSVDFTAYADSLAQETLDRSADGGQSISLGISEWSAWGTFEVGDWLFVYKPEALLSDTDNPMTDKDGRRVYPARKRCLSRKLDMARGDGFEVKVRRPDGTLYDVPDSLVRWADATKATLELGDVRVDFANDPQGPAAGVNFARWRAQQAR